MAAAEGAKQRSARVADVAKERNMVDEKGQEKKGGGRTS
jgi:hypothetical protein